MPLIEVTLVEGRESAAIRDLIDRLHHAVVDSIAANPGSVRVIVREVPPSHWAAGNETLAERAATNAAAPAYTATAVVGEEKP